MDTSFNIWGGLVIGGRDYQPTILGTSIYGTPFFFTMVIHGLAIQHDLFAPFSMVKFVNTNGTTIATWISTVGVSSYGMVLLGNF